MIFPTVQSVDTSNLNRALVLAQEYSTRTPQTAVSTAGFYISRQVTRDVHRATISGIDSQLGVSSTVALSTRGKRKGLPLKSGRMKTTFPRLDAGNLTVADKIIMARMYPGSGVNIAERNRWATTKAAYGTGVSFLQNIRLAARKMIATRHKSIAFIASASRFVTKALEPLVAPKYRSKAVPDDSQAASAASSSATPKGSATVTSQGTSATMTGDMLIGVGGVPANLEEPHNEAMMKYVPGPLQNAIDTEAASTMRHTSEEELKAMEGRFRATGTIIS